MFAVIYQSYLKPGRESDYQKAWRQIANHFVSHRGALGSCLHKAEDGKWIAYSRWPDKATRDASWPGENSPSRELPEEIRQAMLLVKDCIDQDRKLPEICMDVVNDLL
jgi:heme-degrading monooxygenase HmoA